MENKYNVPPVFTTDKFEEAGLRLDWDDNRQMYMYQDSGEEVGEGMITSYNDVWGISPVLVEKYMKDGSLTTRDPNEKVGVIDSRETYPEPKEVCQSEKCDCDFEEDVTNYLESDLLYRVTSLEDKLNQILELLNQKTKKK